MSQGRLNLQDSGGAYLSDPSSGLAVYLTLKEVQQLHEHYQFFCAMEDIRERLEERSDGKLERDVERAATCKYPESVVRKLARQFIRQKNDCESIWDISWDIMNDIINEHEEDLHEPQG